MSDVAATPEISFGEDDVGAVALLPLNAVAFKSWRDGLDDVAKSWVAATGFSAKAGTACALPDGAGAVARMVIGFPDDDGARIWDWAAAARAVPPGRYIIEAAPDGGALDAAAATHAALGWGLAAYSFNRYRKQNDAQGANTDKNGVRMLVWPQGVDQAVVLSALGATRLVRDLINTPAGDMGPAALAAAAGALAAEHDATFTVIEGDDLLDAGYPAIHAVGRASPDAPRLIDLTWGHANDPKITLVGKGVCFDTGGLDIKPASGMKLMKKDMGGAAHVLGLAAMIMDAELPVRLRVLIPAVENSVAGNAMRPLDVVPTRKGLSIEIGHTDAEGRVVLADALAEAVRENPALIIDCATLTGAARVALGTELPALFSNDDDVAAGILEHGMAQVDPMWRMPLWQGYARQVDGKVADVTNSPEGGYGGAITAALFLERFVAPDDGTPPPWVHVDMMAWNLSSRPGKPEGGEAMGMRALFAYLANRFEA